MPAFSAVTKTPQQQVARIAAIYGWSYIVTIFGAFGAWSVPAGPLRVLLLNFGILCAVIGVLELVWRHYLINTGESRWAKILALNEVGGTLALFWSLHLLYEVPEALLYAYAKKSEMWSRIVPLIKASPSGGMLTDDYILRVWHITKIIGVYGLGGILFLSQVWVIYRYLSLARQIARAPAAPPVIQ